MFKGGTWIAEWLFGSMLAETPRDECVTPPARSVPFAIPAAQRTACNTGDTVCSSTECHQSYSPTTIANVNSLVIGRVPKSRSSVGTWVRSDRARDGHTASVKNRWDN
eukprot:1196050-Prorocentrum_minimum.AAC.5